jgi:hypothetical protein
VIGYFQTLKWLHDPTDLWKWSGKGKVIPVSDREGHRVVRRRGSHIFSRQLADRWRWGQPYAPASLYPPGRFLILISDRGWVDSRTIMQLEGLGPLKNPMPSSGIEPATFQLVAQSLNQLRLRVLWWNGRYNTFNWRQANLLTRYRSIGHEWRHQTQTGVGQAFAFHAELRCNCRSQIFWTSPLIHFLSLFLSLLSPAF